jgi:hypothetical protein
LGIRLPMAIAEAEVLPFVWEQASGPVAGGHEILLVGYQEVAGEMLYDLVSWGALYRATGDFLQAVTDEAVCVYDRAGLNARGVNASGLDENALLAYMSRLRFDYV